MPFVHILGAAAGGNFGPTPCEFTSPEAGVDGVRLMGGHEDDLRRRSVARFVGRADPASTRHLDVQKYDVRVKPLRERNRSVAGSGLADDLDVDGVGEESSQQRAGERLIGPVERRTSAGPAKT